MTPIDFIWAVGFFLGAGLNAAMAAGAWESSHDFDAIGEEQASALGRRIAGYHLITALLLVGAAFR